MADVKFRVVTATLNTSTGLQDITLAGFGTPTAAIALWGGVADGTARTDGALFGVGFTDGTNEYSAGISCADNVATADSARIFRDTRIATLLTPSSAGMC